MEGIKINKQKALGTVVYVLEGTKDEYRLFKNIFKKIFSIMPIVCKKETTDLSQYQIKENNDSIVILINSQNSSIKSLENDEYIKRIINKVSIQANIDMFNSAVYFIWDRDNKSNNSETIKSLMEKYRNSRENEYEMNGLLLLSYPSLESFIISCFEEDVPNLEINDMKKYVKSKKYSMSKITDKELVCAINNFLKGYKEIMNKDFDIIDVDLNMKENNQLIFEYEENYYSNNEFYYYFSCIMISLFDLGVFEIED